MALAVFNNPDLPLNLRVKILLWTGLIAIMTILLNGTTTGYFVKLFGLSK